MISKECFTAAWIDEKSKELQYNDKNIIEKVIRAFSLLDMLAQCSEAAILLTMPLSTLPVQPM